MAIYNHELTTNIITNSINNEIINPTLIKEIKDLIHAREKWRKISNYTETIGNVLIIASTITAFAAGIYEPNIVAFIAGCLGSASLSLIKFSMYANKEAIERTASLSKVLNHFNINSIPDILPSNQGIAINNRNIINSENIRNNSPESF